MTSRRTRLVAAGRALDAIAPDERILSVSVDGLKVRNLGRARRTLEKAEAEAERGATTLPPMIDHLVDRLVTRASSRAVSGKRASLVDRARGLIERRVGVVGEEVDVEIRPKRGPARHVRVEVQSPGLTRAVERMTLAFDVCGFIPVLGGAILAGGAVISAVGAVLATLVGHAPLGQALGRSAARRATLCTVDLLPGVGYVSAGLAAAADLEHLRATPTVATIVAIEPPA